MFNTTGVELLLDRPSRRSVSPATLGIGLRILGRFFILQRMHMEWMPSVLKVGCLRSFNKSLAPKGDAPPLGASARSAGHVVRWPLGCLTTGHSRPACAKADPPSKKPPLDRGGLWVFGRFSPYSAAICSTCAVRAMM